MFNIGMAPCSDFGFYKESHLENLNSIAKAHMDVKQFFCPSAFDLSFYGSSDDNVKKSLFIDFKIQKNEYLEGKHILMLINTREPVFTDNYDRVQLKNYTDVMWLPINSRSPMSNTVTFSNH